MIDLKNKKFGRLIVIKYAGKDKFGHSLWLCECDCGKETIILGDSLRTGKTKSCGCITKQRNNSFKHGHGKRNKQSKIYIAWKNMKARCSNQNNKKCIDYSGRGITVCSRWSNKKNGFENFLEDMGEPPTNKHQINRINNNLGYYKENCNWVLSKENNRNRRSNHLIKYNEKEKCCAEWEEVTGIPQRTIARRINDGWSIERALKTPVEKYKNK